MEFLQAYGKQVLDIALLHAPQWVMAAVVLWIGLMIIGGMTKVARKAMEKRQVDATLRPFFGSLINWTLKAMLFISVASMVGIETTSFVAILGAAGLAVGLALQGSLSNFAGGVLLLIFRPYKVGDLVETQGHLGVVKEIQIFVTILASPDNKMLVIPNGPISNGNIVNYTALGKIRVDLTIGIAYDADLKKAREVLIDVMSKHPKVLKEKGFEPFVGVQALTDSDVSLAVRPHCHPDHYWDVYFDIYEQSKLALNAAGVDIPFRQIDLYIKEQPK
jgi:small conductance mechanosensitive channel